MIELNLLPKELRKDRRKHKFIFDLPILPISVSVIVFFVFLHFSFTFLALNKRALLKTLKSKWNLMQPQREKTEKIAIDLSSLEKKSSAIRALAKPDLEWSELLSGLNQAMVSKVWLSVLEPKFPERKGAAPVSLYLTGYALGKSEEATPHVAKFINSLKGVHEFSRYFDGIELIDVRSQELSGQEVMMFKLEGRFKPIATTIPEKKENTKDVKL